MCGLLSLQVLFEILFDLRIIERYIIKSLRKASYEVAVSYSHQIFMKVDYFLDTHSTNIQTSNFTLIRSVEAELFQADGQKNR